MIELKNIIFIKILNIIYINVYLIIFSKKMIYCSNIFNVKILNKIGIECLILNIIFCIILFLNEYIYIQIKKKIINNKIKIFNFFESFTYKMCKIFLIGSILIGCFFIYISLFKLSLYVFYFNFIFSLFLLIYLISGKYKKIYKNLLYNKIIKNNIK